MVAFKVSPERLHQLADLMMQNSRGISDKLDTLGTNVGQLIGNWDGEAQQAYHTAQRQWDNSAHRINGILGEISGKTHQIASRYSSTDGRQASRFGG